ncbi:30S ribosomal protein S20 [Patescibacteria group bacterium]|nr:30S ribosomal protein S20 [Patescibacteria group bacterium]
MPTTPSAKKALRRDQKRTVRNIKRKKTVKDLIKKTLKTAEAGEMDKVQDLLKQTQKAIDKAVKRGVIKKNTANRKKSRLVARVRKIKK